MAILLLFVGAVLLAIGMNVPTGAPCSRVGAILLAVGFGIQFVAGLQR